MPASFYREIFLVLSSSSRSGWLCCCASISLENTSLWCSCSAKQETQQCLAGVAEQDDFLLVLRLQKRPLTQCIIWLQLNTLEENTVYFGVQVWTLKLSLCFQDFRKIFDAEGFWETIVSKLLITFIVASLLFLNTYKNDLVITPKKPMHSMESKVWPFCEVTKPFFLSKMENCVA